ncbi:MAG TPA: hypothetical protein VLK35_17600 [Methylomirabilota bacterium]|nr:hypothetical protein [Methylomirabilota bacterium]
MTTDPPDPIAAAAARYKRDNEKAKASRQELTDLVLDALRQPKAEPIDIAKRAEWTPAYVRKLAREKGIEADPSYKARTEKARARLLAEASVQTAAAPRQQVTQAVRKPVPGISPKVMALPYDRIKELADRAEDHDPDWVDEIRQDYPHLRGPDLDLVIVELGHQKGFKIKELDEPTEPKPADRPVTDEEAAQFAARARSKANEMQSKKLDQIVESAAEGSKDFAVMHAGLDMGLLSHDEVYAVPDHAESSEEQTA